MNNYYNEVISSIFRRAEEEKAKLNHKFVGTEHLLLAILKSDDEVVKVLNNNNLDYDSFLNEVKSMVDPSEKKVTDNIYTPLLKKVIMNAGKENELTARSLVFGILDEGEGVAIRLLFNLNIDIDNIYNILKDDSKEKNLSIYTYGKLLNKYIDSEEKIIGRDKEIEMIIETLLRKKKNNPLLIGKAGVGKTAVVEELARRITKGEVPSELANKKIVMLEMGSLIGGTKYRGEFEERLSLIIKEIMSNDNIILFIDEIHSMVNAGAAEGAISASDILKPYLARGDIKCIGSTTLNEYEKNIGNDKALCRRFENIFIDEPSEEKTIDIVKGVKEEYEAYHQMHISDDLVACLVHLANVYYPNKHNPDKALELLDSVMSYVKLKIGNNLVKEKKLELKKVGMQKMQMIENGDYKEALKITIKENRLNKELMTLKEGKNLYVTKDDIIDVLEHKNNIIINEVKVNNIKTSNKTAISKIMKYLPKCKVSTFLLNGDSNTFINELALFTKYSVLKLNEEKDIEKIIKKVKYNLGNIIVCDIYNNYKINTFLNKIISDSMIEDNDEYINFSGSIVLIKSKNNVIGFDKKEQLSIKFDEIFNFKIESKV